MNFLIMHKFTNQKSINCVFVFNEHHFLMKFYNKLLKIKFLK